MKFYIFIFAKQILCTDENVDIKFSAHGAFME
jgi:hypothetical protein